MSNTIWTLIGIAIIYSIWTFGFKAYFISRFREDLFALRAQLFDLAASKKIDYNSELYRAFELLLNSTIQHAPKVGFLRTKLIIYFLKIKGITGVKYSHNEIIRKGLADLQRRNPELAKELTIIRFQYEWHVIMFLVKTSFLLKLVVLKEFLFFVPAVIAEFQRKTFQEDVKKQVVDANKKTVDDFIYANELQAAPAAA